MEPNQDLLRIIEDGGEDIVLVCTQHSPRCCRRELRSGKGCNMSGVDVYISASLEAVVLTTI